MSKENPVKHYDFEGLSPLEIFKLLEKKDQMSNYEAFCRFNAIKYIWRYPQKNGKDDLLKAMDYIRLLIENKYEVCQLKEEKKIDKESYYV